MTYDELVTVVTEVEMILNSRPLSHVSIEDLEEPLTPSHLLMSCRVLSQHMYTQRMMIGIMCPRNH